MAPAVWLGALLVGLTLGLLGSGGSILTVPVLVYLVGQPDKVAIAGSLAIVGAIAAVGALPYAFRGRVDWRNVLSFGLPGVVGAWGGAAVSRYVPGTVQLLLFSVVVLAAAWLMYRPPTRGVEAGDAPQKRRAVWKIGLDGLVVGAFTGLVGVGGGFLIVPALVLLGGLPMTLAVGTSLVIIAMKSASGLWEYLNVLAEMDLTLDARILAPFIALGILGSFAGNLLSTRLPQRALRLTFATLLVAVGLYTAGTRIPELLAGS